MFPRATQIKTYSWDNAQVVLIGNKLDLEDDRQVPAEDAQRLATELGQLTQVVNRNKPNFTLFTSYTAFLSLTRLPIF